MEHNTEDRLRVGVITSSHGIKGEVKVYPTTDDNDRFKTLKKCYLSNGRETLEVNCTSCKFLKNMVILKFKEYDNIKDIERFKNYDILVDREESLTTCWRLRQMMYLSLRRMMAARSLYQ